MPMGDWRHFGERLEFHRACGPMSDGLTAFADGPPSPRPALDIHRAEPRRHGIDHAADHAADRSAAVPDALARIVEGEILPRLMLAHRRAPRGAAAGRGPTPAEIAAFSAMLLAPGPVDIDAQVAALRDGGLPLPRLLLDLLAPAARHLGALWEEDACDFLAVTEGLGRLQAIGRRVCAQLEDDSVAPAGRSILLLPCPGETHLFGLSIVASFFREAGWDVTIACPGPDGDAVAPVREGWFDVVGLSLSCEVFLPALAAVVPALRGASRNPDLRVIVGGPLFARGGADAHGVGADACAPDGRQAPRVAGALLDRRALAC